uniref:Uncharacterized protein n=1 Tax=Amphimedon queenslandica TaxID=400682 RepID=A0A1X7U6V4_AMPQE
MALVILLLFAFFVNEAQAKCSQSASLSVFLLQSNSPIEADEINNLTDIRNGLGYEEDESCCLYYVEDNEGNDVNVTACKDTEIDNALDAINTTEYYYHVLVLGKEGTSLNYTLHKTRNINRYLEIDYYYYKASITLIGRGSPTIKFSGISFNFINTVNINNVTFIEGMIKLLDIQNIRLTSVTIRNSPSRTSSLQYMYQIITLIVLTFHSIIMPYKSTWLNALDSFFLANLLLIALTYGLTATTIYQSSSISIQSAITGILILFPLVYGVLGFLFALCLKIPQKHRDRMKLWIFFRKEHIETMSSVIEPLEQPLLRSVSAAVDYREPALGLLDDDNSTIRGRKKSKIVHGSTVVERPLTTSYNQEWQDNTPDENERRLSIRHTQIEDEDL